MPALPAALFKPDESEVDVELVMDDDNMLVRDLVEIRELAHGPSGDIHKRRGDREQGRDAPENRLGDVRPALVPRQFHAGAVGQLGEDVGADVMPVPGIPASGVAESDDEPGIHGGRNYAASGRVPSWPS